MSIRLDEARIRLLNINGGIQPTVNNTYNLGTSSLKWANVYATTFQGALNGNATTSSYPYGFASYTSGATWGNTTGTSITCWNDSTGGSVDWRRDNPSSGKISMKVDGRVYVNEGVNPVMGMNTDGSYWCMGDPDGISTNWIRTTSLGIIPYQSGGSSSLGTASWPFNSAYINTVYGNLSGNAATATKLATAKTISLTGSVIGSGSFDGSDNLSISTTTNHNHDSSYVKKSGDTMTGNLTVPTVIGNLQGNASTMSCPLGFSGKGTNNWTNGDFTSDGFTTYVTDWDEPSGGSIYWASNSIGQLSAGVDGYFYQGRDLRDGKLHRCLDTYDLANNTFNRANYANYLNNASHSISISSSTWSASNPWNMTNKTLVWGQQGRNSSYSSDSADICLYYGNTSASGGAGWFLMIDGGIYSMGGIYGAVWNDYAEFRICDEEFKPGQVVLENGDDTLSIASQRLQRGCSIVSDTFGFAIGETDEAKCPIAVSGRVLAYPFEPIEEFRNHIGYPVCSGPNGTVSIMTEEEEEKYPSRIIGTVSAIPNYEIWGTGNVPVNGRIWIKVV